MRRAGGRRRPVQPALRRVTGRDPPRPGASTRAAVRSGLEQLLARPRPSRGLRVGLIANPTAVTADLVARRARPARRAGVPAGRAVRAGARDLGRRPGPRRGRGQPRPGDRPARPQPVRPHARPHRGDAAPASTPSSSTCRTWAPATTRSSTRCCTAMEACAAHGKPPGRARPAQPARRSVPSTATSCDAEFRVVRRPASAARAARHDGRASWRSCSATSAASTSTCASSGCGAGGAR